MKNLRFFSAVTKKETIFRVPLPDKNKTELCQTFCLTSLLWNLERLVSLECLCLSVFLKAFFRQPENFLGLEIWYVNEVSIYLQVRASKVRRFCWKIRVFWTLVSRRKIHFLPEKVVKTFLVLTKLVLGLVFFHSLNLQRCGSRVLFVLLSVVVITFAFQTRFPFFHQLLWNRLIFN